MGRLVKAATQGIFTAEFAYSKAISKDLVVGEWGVPVAMAGSKGGVLSLQESPTDDSIILLLKGMVMFRSMTFFCEAGDGARNLAKELTLLQSQNKNLTFSAALGFRKQVLGVEGVLYRLKDKAASLVGIDEVGGLTVVDIGLRFPEFERAVPDDGWKFKKL